MKLTSAQIITHSNQNIHTSRKLRHKTSAAKMRNLEGTQLVTSSRHNKDSQNNILDFQLNLLNLRII